MLRNVTGRTAENDPDMTTRVVQEISGRYVVHVNGAVLDAGQKAAAVGVEGGAVLDSGGDVPQANCRFAATGDNLALIRREGQGEDRPRVARPFLRRCLAAPHPEPPIASAGEHRAVRADRDGDNTWLI